MAHITVLPRETTTERPDEEITVAIDEAYTVDVATIEDWASAARPGS